MQHKWVSASVSDFRACAIHGILTKHCVQHWIERARVEKTIGASMCLPIPIKSLVWRTHVCCRYIVAQTPTKTPAQTATDALVKAVSEAVASTHLSVQLAAMHAWIYLIDATVINVVVPTMPLVSEFLLTCMNPALESLQPKVRTTAFAAAFLLIEKFPSQSESMNFTRRAIDFAVEMVTENREGNAVLECITRGLDRLLLCFVALTPVERTRIRAVANTGCAVAVTSKSQQDARCVVPALDVGRYSCFYLDADASFGVSHLL